MHLKLPVTVSRGGSASPASQSERSPNQSLATSQYKRIPATNLRSMSRSSSPAAASSGHRRAVTPPYTPSKSARSSSSTVTAVVHKTPSNSDLSAWTHRSMAAQATMALNDLVSETAQPPGAVIQATTAVQPWVHLLANAAPRHAYAAPSLAAKAATKQARLLEQQAEVGKQLAMLCELGKTVDKAAAEEFRGRFRSWSSAKEALRLAQAQMDHQPGSADCLARLRIAHANFVKREKTMQGLRGTLERACGWSEQLDKTLKAHRGLPELRREVQLAMPQPLWPSAM